MPVHDMGLLSTTASAICTTISMSLIKRGTFRLYLFSRRVWHSIQKGGLGSLPHPCEPWAPNIRGRSVGPVVEHHLHRSSRVVGLVVLMGGLMTQQDFQLGLISSFLGTPLVNPYWLSLTLSPRSNFYLIPKLTVTNWHFSHLFHPILSTREMPTSCRQKPCLLNVEQS